MNLLANIHMFVFSYWIVCGKINLTMMKTFKE